MLKYIVLMSLVVSTFITLHQSSKYELDLWQIRRSNQPSVCYHWDRVIHVMPHTLSEKCDSVHVTNL